MTKAVNLSELSNASSLALANSSTPVTKLNRQFLVGVLLSVKAKKGGYEYQEEHWMTSVAPDTCLSALSVRIRTIPNPLKSQEFLVGSGLHIT